ncbi:MAG: hypothetical protein JOY71_26735 [Acetobacteraceae bacterium]|nr:hypothetical protein [Acetobacteraceae bacterium]
MICDFFTERSGPQDSSQVGGFLAVLRPLALYHLKDRDLADWIGRRTKRLFGRTKRFGMTDKNRRRLPSSGIPGRFGTCCFYHTSC